MIILDRPTAMDLCSYRRRLFDTVLIKLMCAHIVAEKLRDAGPEKIVEARIYVEQGGQIQGCIDQGRVGLKPVRGKREQSGWVADGPPVPGIEKPWGSLQANIVETHPFLPRGGTPLRKASIGASVPLDLDRAAVSPVAIALKAPATGRSGYMDGLLAGFGNDDIVVHFCVVDKARPGRRIRDARACRIGRNVEGVVVDFRIPDPPPMRWLPRNGSLRIRSGHHSR